MLARCFFIVVLLSTFAACESPYDRAVKQCIAAGHSRALCECTLGENSSANPAATAPSSFVSCLINNP